MKNYDISQIQLWQKDLNQTISLSIHVRQKNSNDPFFRFGNALESACEHIDITFIITDALPKIQIRDNLHFHSIPEGTEIQPFSKALTYISSPPVKSAEYDGIETLTSSKLLLFVSPFCPNCPTVLQKILPIVWLNPDIELTIIDVGLFPQEAETRSIQSVPTLIFKDFRWTGPVKISEIMDVIQNAPDQWDTKSLERMLSEGKAIQLAQTILENGKFVKNFGQLIAHELLSIRLGAMVCVEYIADENPTLAQSLCEQIWPLLLKSSVQVQGDLIYLIGICGTEKDIPKLKDMMAQAVDNDIKDSITEAIEAIQEQIRM
jgi:thiol-disulfide isomerase/thioredoxin